MPVPIHLERFVKHDAAPPFVPGQVIVVTYRLHAIDQAVTITQLEQTVVRGWHPHTMAKEHGWSTKDGHLIWLPNQVIRPGDMWDVPVWFQAMGFRTGSLEDLPSLVAEAKTGDGVSFGAPSLEPLQAPPMQQVEVGMRARVTEDGRKGQVAIKNIGDVDLGPVHVQLSSGVAVSGGRDLGQGRTEIERLPSGGKVMLDVALDDWSDFMATIVEAFCANGTPVPPQLLPVATANGEHQLRGRPDPRAAATLPRRKHEEVREHPSPAPSQRVGEADGEVRILDGEVRDTPETITVGDRITLTATLVNGSDDDLQNVRVTATVDGTSITLRDSRWREYRPGLAMTLVEYLPVDHEVTVEMEVRVNKQGRTDVDFDRELSGEER